MPDKPHLADCVSAGPRFQHESQLPSLPCLDRLRESRLHKSDSCRCRRQRTGKSAKAGRRSRSFERSRAPAAGGRPSQAQFRHSKNQALYPTLDVACRLSSEIGRFSSLQGIRRNVWRQGHPLNGQRSIFSLRCFRSHRASVTAIPGSSLTTERTRPCCRDASHKETLENSCSAGARGQQSACPLDASSRQVSKAQESRQCYRQRQQP